MGTISPEDERGLLLGCLGLITGVCAILGALGYSAYKIVEYFIG